MDIPLPGSKRLAAGQRRKAVDERVLGGVPGSLAEGLSQPRLALLLGSDNGLLARLADKVDLGLGGASNSQQSHHVGLVHDAQSRVVSAVIALPVRVVGDVACRDGDGVVVGGRVVGTGGRVAESRVQGNTIGAIGVDGEDFAKGLPDAGRLDGVFLREESLGQYGGILMKGASVEVRPLKRETATGLVATHLGDRHQTAGGLCNRLARHDGGSEVEELVRYRRTEV